MGKDRLVGMGPCPVQSYPLSAWTEWPAAIKASDVWKLCGPAVEKHQDKLPLWQVFCVVYIEGLQHGSQIEAEKHTVKE